MDRVRLHSRLVDMGIVFSDTWACVASGVVFIRCYQSLLKRIVYVALLCYWFIFSRGRGYPELFTEILMELYRSKSSRFGERNELGRHWTINIAEIVLISLFCWIFDYLLPGHYWKLSALVLLVTVFFQRSYLGQLWLQKQLKNLARLDREVWMWGAFAVEWGCSSLVHRLDNSVTRAIMTAWWWSCHQFVNWMTPEVTDRLGDSWYVMALIYWFIGSKPQAQHLWRMLSYATSYRFILRELARFADPNPPQHEYTPLKNPEDIRVLLLHPRLGFRPICCSLVQGPHMRLLFYETISYTWGSMDTSEEILVDGCRKKVTKSVYEILASYSSLLLPQLLWIDAICIDQESESEKSQQVPLMEKIYRNCLFTTVFLGRSPLAEEQRPHGSPLMPYRYDGIHAIDMKTQTYFEDTRLAVDLLNEFRILGDALRSSKLETYKKYDKLQLSKSNGREWAALVKILGHPVFERVWVVQEVALSPNVRVRCGDEVIDWRVLASGMEMLQDRREFCLWLELTHSVQLRHIQHTRLFNLTRIQRFRQTCRPQEHLEDWLDGWDTGLCALLAESFYFKATDPRDLIYGLMSLCQDPVKVSYKNSVEVVYLNAAKELIRRGAIQLLLHAAGVGNRLDVSSTVRDLPSWVPDWQNSPRYPGLQRSEKSWPLGERQVRSEAKAAINLKIDRVMAISGTCIDVIEELGLALFDTTQEKAQSAVDELQQLLINYKACCQILEDSPHTTDVYHHTTQSQSLREAFRRTILTNKEQRFLEAFSRWEEVLKILPPEFGKKLRDNKDVTYWFLELMDKLTEVMRSCCGGRRLFITKKGYIGLCPPYTLRGDLVYVVPGLQVSILLRHDSIVLKGHGASQSLAKRYKLVGECYTHGLKTEETCAVGTAEEVEIV